MVNFNGDGIPLALTMFDGNQNEQPALIPLEKQLNEQFSVREIVKTLKNMNLL